MIEELLLLSGNNIPFRSAQTSVFQPTVKEIAYIGEENFFIGCQLLNFSKDVLSEEDRDSLADIDNFDILMSIVSDGSAETQVLCAEMVLSLLFPDCSISFSSEGVHLDYEGFSTIINKENYEEFKEILMEIFALKGADPKDEFKPKGDAAQRIADKLKKGREKVAQAKGETSKKIAVFGRYTSILAIGLRMDMNIFLNHTVYQLYDEFKRFQMYQAFDINLKAKMAGATDLEEVDNWMEDIHS